jgi:hypothetical protein
MQKTRRINTRNLQKHDKNVFNLNNTIPHSVRLVDTLQKVMITYSMTNILVKEPQEVFCLVICRF